MKMTLNSDQLTTGMLGKKVELSNDILSDENDTKFWSIDYRVVRQKVELSYDTLSDENDT